MFQCEEAELWCFKRRGKDQTSVVLRRSREIKVFQDRKSIVYGRDELLQCRNRHIEGDAANLVTVLECQHYSLFIFRGEAMNPAAILNDERERRGICQHVCYGCSTCTNKAKMQVRSRPKYEVPPPSADMRGLVPPPFVAPIPVNIASFLFLEGPRLTEIKYREK